LNGWDTWSETRNRETYEPELQFCS
jgi:hypothetical protein